MARGRSQASRFSVPYRALGALGVIALFLVVASAIDTHVAAQVAQWRGPVLDGLVDLLNPIGSGVTLLLMCAALGLVCHRLRRSRLHDAAWLASLAFAGAGLIEFGLKHLVGRPRPDSALPALLLLGPSFVPDIDSFPSGHATSVFTVATVFASFYPRLAWPLYLLAAAVALGRVYLGRHYVSDVLAGALIGILVARWLLGHRRRIVSWMRIWMRIDAVGRFPR
ncbi:MAG TPA: phosphatase PAP2 family protein [Candidatus Nitrosotalea sp.]|jgi:membrane-associated phospholipid phosphatase|nr:phosphatase PAP2 family protein [Candidatus Nitrosotalea sp.]